MRVLIAGGGTGGHLFPGVALAEEIISRGTEHQVLFVGTRRGVEVQAVPRAGFKLELIEVGGLKGRGIGGWVRGLLRLPRALWQSRRIIRKFRPHVVVGVGGYASGPVLLAAAFLRLPTAVLEQNALPGFTNRVLGRFVRKVFVAFPESLRFFKSGKALLLGNPVRQALVCASGKERESAGGQQLLIFGGSQGANVFNRIVPEAVRLLRERHADLKVVHQTGERDQAAVQQRYQELGIQAEVLPFIHDMAAAYRDADLVVCRAGATTVAELTLCRRPALLIPFPYAADNHQEVNARALVSAGAAVMIREAELDPQRLAGEAAAILGDKQRSHAMEQAAGRIGRPEAAREICQVCLELGSGSRWYRREQR